VELIAQATGQDEAIKKLQAANDNLERSNAALVQRIEALEARFKAANDNQAAGPKALKTGHP
jgi:phage shock protein A